MIHYFLEKINRQISKLHIVYSMNVVSIDQITFTNELTLIKTNIVKTPKNGK
ncbi:hypothetical protein UFOVP105_34 [uncultured Caudovirales phage]|uniref:Uncharacterized protein n=1 Tax=uncultured Caudovirales phage TaxID=2100421 RepID=A0A6J5L203_9CAUD|nr:hypothetical protein UFOVP105_34 [uncultured Caudovirales phage]